MTRKHFKHFPIAGFTYWEGPLAFNKLKVGRELHLIAEPDNRYDPMAVAVYYKRYKLGYIPKNANAEISTLLQLGHTHLFQAVVQRIDATENPENQVGVVVYGVKLQQNKTLTKKQEHGIYKIQFDRKHLS